MIAMTMMTIMMLMKIYDNFGAHQLLLTYQRVSMLLQANNDHGLTPTPNDSHNYNLSYHVPPNISGLPFLDQQINIYSIHV